MAQNKYRIRQVVSDNGDKFYPEIKGWFGWGPVYLRVVADGDARLSVRPVVDYDGYPSGMTLARAKMCIDFRVAQDNEKEVIIDYP